MQEVKVRGQRSRSQRSWPHLTVSGPKLQFEFTYDNEMMHKASCCLEEVPFCFSRCSVRFQGHMDTKIVDFDWNWAFPDCNSSLNLPNGYEIKHKDGSSIGEVPYWFSRSSIKFQGHTGQKIANFDWNWAFPDCNSSFNSPMALKWCTKLNVV